MTINAILAHDKYYGIGKDNALPWPPNQKDMKWFKDNTKGGVIVMGSKTWESLLSTKLPGRVNCVITSDPSKITGTPDRICNGDMFSILKLIKADFPEKKIWIIGGANIYSQAIPFCDNVYVTEFHSEYDCDTFFDATLLDGFISATSGKKDSTVSFNIWTRI